MSLPAPPSFCDSLQPYLDAAAKQAGVTSAVKCFSTPGIAEAGYAGPQDDVFERRLSKCLADAESPSIQSEAAPFNFSWEYKAEVSATGGGGVDLSFLGKWAPNLKGAGGNAKKAEVRLVLTEARWRRVTDLAPTLLNSTSDRAPECLTYLCRKEILYTTHSLIGHLNIVVDADTAVDWSGGVSFLDDVIGFETKGVDKAAGKVTLQSTDLVVVGAALKSARETMDRSAACCDTVRGTYYKDADGDGYGDKKTAFKACGQPAGSVTNGDDCFDQNANARPNQSAWFEQHRGDGSYDFDCSGAEEKRETRTDGGCFREGNLPTGNCTANQGWVGAAPGCGTRGKWLDDCDTVSSFGFPPKIAECTRREESEKAQGCR